MARSRFTCIGSFAICAALACATAFGATKPAAAPPQPEPLNTFKPEEAKKDDKKDVPAKDAPPSPAAAAATPAPPATANTMTAPAPSTATAPPAISPAAPPPAPAAPAAEQALQQPPSAAATSPGGAPPDGLARLVERVTVTDVLIAVFAFLVAVFAWRVSRANTLAAATSHGQLDANRRAIEASERAAEAAKRSAEAAERSAAVLQETAARQLRPYVTVKEFLQGPVKDENNFLHGWVFQVVWQNSGATPTRGFRYWAALRQFDHQIPDDFDFAPPVMADFAGGELGAGSTVTSGTLFVPQADVAQIQGAARKAVLYGKAEYSDVLGGDAKRETRFAVEVILVADPGGANGTPFSFSYYPRHNAIS